MTANSPAEVLTPAPAPEAFTEAVLEIITAATWADGSPLIDLDETVLRRELVTKIRAAAYALAASASLVPTAPFGGAR